MTENSTVSLSGQADRPTAYSYVRMSLKRQQLGDSLRRQVEAAENYAKEHSLELSPRTFRDLGVSGFKQRNVKKGALAAFIGAVKSGLISPGSYLLIEQFDRLSRAEINVAFRLLLDLVDLNITVVTLVDERVWNSETVQDVANVLTSVILMSRAHEESKMKAKRLSAVWGHKKTIARTSARGQSQIVTSECPRWLAPTADKTGFDVLQDRAESVSRVFDMRINGFGIVSIVSRANSEGWPVPGKRPVQRADEDDESFAVRRAQGMTWHTSLVGRLLKNRAVLGEYQPFKTEYVKIKDEADKRVRVPIGDPILGYYPAVITEETYLRAQAKADRSGRFPGRRDASLKNWLQGLLKCTCGQSFVRKSKESKTQPGYARYYCNARNRGVTKCPSASATELEDAVLTVVSQVAPQYFEGTGRQEELKAKSDLLAVDVSAGRQSLAQYVKAIGEPGASVSALVQRMSEVQAALDAREHELDRVRAELADLAGDFDSVFANIVAEVRNIDSLDARARLREDLSRVMEKVVVHQEAGYIQVFLRAEKIALVHPLRPDAMLPHTQSEQGPDDTRIWTEI